MAIHKEETRGLIQEEEAPLTNSSEHEVIGRNSKMMIPSTVLPKGFESYNKKKATRLSNNATRSYSISSK